MFVVFATVLISCALNKRTHQVPYSTIVHESLLESLLTLGCNMEDSIEDIHQEGADLVK
jgi:hypothetical protein